MSGSQARICQTYPQTAHIRFESLSLRQSTIGRRKASGRSPAKLVQMQPIRHGKAAMAPFNHGGRNPRKPHWQKFGLELREIKSRRGLAATAPPGQFALIPGNGRHSLCPPASQAPAPSPPLDRMRRGRITHPALARQASTKLSAGFEAPGAFQSVPAHPRRQVRRRKCPSPARISTCTAESGTRGTYPTPAPKPG